MNIFELTIQFYFDNPVLHTYMCNVVFVLIGLKVTSRMRTGIYTYFPFILMSIPQRVTNPTAKCIIGIMSTNKDRNFHYINNPTYIILHKSHVYMYST